MRITDNIRLFDMGRTISELTARQADAAQRASTGRRLTKPSDDPVGAAKLARLSASLEQAGTLRSTISLVQDDVSSAEDVLAQSMELFTRARELALQGANGTLNSENRLGLAKEVASLKAQLVALSNTKGSYGSLFAGHKIDSPAFDGTGAYLGDGGFKQIEVSPGVAIRASLSGEKAFGGANGGVNVFGELDTLETALVSNDTALVSATLSGLDTAHAQLSQSRSDAGLIMNRMSTADLTLQQAEIGLTKRQSNLADADAFQSISELSRVGSTLEQAISVARTILDNNLVRF